MFPTGKLLGSTSRPHRGAYFLMWGPPFMTKHFRQFLFVHMGPKIPFCLKWSRWAQTKGSQTVKHLER